MPRTVCPAALESIIADTQRMVQPLVPRPALTVKLLSKPPFLFLFDVIKGLMAATGFPPNSLFAPEEQDPEYFKVRCDGWLTVLPGSCVWQHVQLQTDAGQHLTPFC